MIISLKRIGKKPFFEVYDEDGELMGIADYDSVGKLKLKDGIDTDADILAEEIAESECRVAKSHSYYLLAKKDRSSGELAKKLSELGLGKKAVSYAVDEMISRGYVNNAEYAHRVALYYASSGYGPYRISLELKKKEFPQDIIDSEMDCITDEYDFAASLSDVCERKFGDVADVDYEQRAKISAFLARRGFSFEQISGFFK